MEMVNLKFSICKISNLLDVYCISSFWLTVKNDSGLFHPQDIFAQTGKNLLPICRNNLLYIFLVQKVFFREKMLVSLNSGDQKPIKFTH